MILSSTLRTADELNFLLWHLEAYAIAIYSTKSRNKNILISSLIKKNFIIHKVKLKFLKLCQLSLEALENFLKLIGTYYEKNEPVVGGQWSCHFPLWNRPIPYCKVDLSILLVFFF